MARTGRPRLSIEEKAKRGTLRPWRERAYQAEALGQPQLPPGPAKTQKPAKNYAALCQFYLEGVLSGRIVACRWVQLACERQRRDLARGADEFSPYVWDSAQADAACAFVEQLPHVEGRWETATLQLEPWQVFLVSLLFGWRVRADVRRRRFTTFYLEVGRKAAKSTLMAALAYYHLLQEDEPGASVICGATTGAQARIVFAIMQKMGQRSAFLAGQGVRVLANSIITPDGVAKPVNAKASTQDGLNPSCTILDEGHAQNFGLHDVLKSSQGARGNPLMLCPTTAGYDLLSVGYALHQQVEKTLEQVIVADHLLGVIYTLDPEDDWRDSRVWVKACPMIGVSPKFEYVEKYCLDAQQVPGVEGEFRVKICSQWMQSSSRWLSLTAWDKCADATLSIETFLGQPCWIANDLAATDDLAATVLLFEQADGLVAFLRCYLPAEIVELRARRVPEYRIWAEDGILIKTDGTLTDFARIEADLRADYQRFKVQEIVFDQFGSQQIAGNLSNSGLPAIVEPKNAKTCTPGARDLEVRVTHQKIRHDGNSLFRWFASNAQVTRRTDDSLLPKKDGPESPNKIDGVDALVAALGSRLRKQQQRQREVQMVIIGGRKA